LKRDKSKRTVNALLLIHGVARTISAFKKDTAIMLTTVVLYKMVLILHMTQLCLATLGSPFGFTETQPDGSNTPKLYINGDAHLNYLTDKHGFIVMTDKEDKYVYAHENGTSGKIKRSGIMPGNVPVGHSTDLSKERVHKSRLLQIMQPSSVINRRKLTGTLPARQPITHGTLNNMVVLICFADHVDRTLPTKTDIEILYNRSGGHPQIAPSGSVRDYFTQSSYGKLDIISEVFDWIILPQIESHYANGKSGDSDIFLESIYYALDLLESNEGFSFGSFDNDNDGYLDAITILHSGYGAEWGSTDYFGTNFRDRIWSHKLNLPPKSRWKSSDETVMNSYHVSSAIYGIRGSDIARIGTLAHELGHFLSLRDLYDKDGGGRGVGSYCVMGDSWGFDGSQLYPGVMSVWSKMQLGWITPTLIKDEGRYSLNTSQLNEEAYLIKHGFKEGEYLLLENRQSVGFDRNLFQGGIAIWHIDEGQESSQSKEGYPDQKGWPANGNHYKIALLQADGLFDLERGYEFRGKGDLFHKNGVDRLGPSSDLLDGPFPNSDSYQGGHIQNTGVHINDISEAGYSMFFNVSFGTRQQIDEHELKTTFDSDSGLAGNMFSIVAKKDIVIRGLHIHMMPLQSIPLLVWKKVGSYRGFEHDKQSWELLMNLNVTGSGIGLPTKITSSSFEPFTVFRTESISLYITLDRNGMRYTLGSIEGVPISTNQDLTILEGNGIEYPFGNIYSPRIWNGAIIYDVLPDASTADITSVPQSPTPSRFPSLMPTLQVSAIKSSKPSIIKESDSDPYSGDGSEKELASTFRGGSGLSGSMFTLKAFNCISITNIDVNVAIRDPIIEVWVRLGNYLGYERDRSSWTLHFVGVVKGIGPSKIPQELFDTIRLDEYSDLSVYVTVQGETGMIYTRGVEEGRVFSQNEDLAILEGVGVRYPFGQSFSPRIWNGSVSYVQNSCQNSQCPKNKIWKEWKQKCVPRCRKRHGQRFNWSLDKCVAVG
jgi:M6 family metalloprotease-like protein